MATLNVRIEEEMKRKLQETVARRKEKRSRVVKELLAEQLLIEGLAERGDWEVPDWIPQGRYAAVVKGAVAAVGDSPSEVLNQAVAKFPDESIQVKRKGASIRRIEYAFLALGELKCWRYVPVGETEYPVVPVTLVGRRRVAAAAMPDTAASISLAGSELISSAALRPIGTREIFTGGGPVKLRVFKGSVELAGGRYETDIAATTFPEEFPTRLLLGRNVLDSIDTYVLGKKRIVCVRDP